jgi:ABC-type Na+ efflux pump permease subunit
VKVNRVRELFRKDFAELRSNRSVFISLFVFPVLFLLEGIGSAIARSLTTTSSRAALVASYISGASLSLDLLLFVPVITAVTIGSNSIVQEKTTHSLEPLLATPITDTELLVGKAMTPLLPGLIAVWVCYTVLFAVIDVLAWPVTHAIVFPTAVALFQMWIIAPLLGLLGTFGVLTISSWAKDARAAQQMSTVIELPAIGLILVVFLFLPSSWEVLGLFAVGLAVVSYALLRMAIRRFDRPSILVSWR